MTSETDNTNYLQIDNSSIAPCKKGIPDLYNHLPSRVVTLVEAKARGWTYYYEEAVCLHGHIAPRYVSNPRMCVDCHRAAKNRRLIGVRESEANDVCEDQRGLSWPSRPNALPFEWSPEKRAQLIEHWVDTGAIADARTAIGGSLRVYWRYSADIESTTGESNGRPASTALVEAGPLAVFEPLASHLRDCRKRIHKYRHSQLSIREPSVL